MNIHKNTRPKHPGKRWGTNLLRGAVGLAVAASIVTAGSLPARAHVMFTINTGHDNLANYAGTIDLQCPGLSYPRSMYLFITSPVALTGPVTWATNGGPAVTVTGDPFGNLYRGVVSLNSAVPVGTMFTVTATDAAGNTGSITLTVVPCHYYAGRAQGDVHVYTFDDLPYDFQQAGEVVDAQTTDQSFSVQSRLIRLATKQVTETAAVAANDNGDHVGLYIDSQGQPQWHVNGSVVTVPSAGLNLPQGGTIAPTTGATVSNEWTVTWPGTAGVASGTTLVVAAILTPGSPHIDINALTLGPGLAGQGLVAGILGNSDRNPVNDLTPFGGGAAVSPDCQSGSPAYSQPLYRTFGASWLVAGSLPGQPANQPTSLFDNDTPSSWVIPNFPASCTPKPKITLTQAQAACAAANVPAFPASADCAADVSWSGSKGWVAGYAQQPPFTCNISGTASFVPALGLTAQTVKVKITSKLTGCASNSLGIVSGKATAASQGGQPGVTCDADAPSFTITTKGTAKWNNAAANKLTLSATSVSGSDPPTSQLSGETSTATGSAPAPGTTLSGSISDTVTPKVQSECAAGTLSKLRFTGTTTFSA
jgi:hypothetical protein